MSTMLWAGLPGGGGPAEVGAHADPALPKTSLPALLNLEDIRHSGKIDK